MENVVLEQEQQSDDGKAGRADNGSPFQERIGAGIARSVGQVEPQLFQLFVGVYRMQVYRRAAGNHRQNGDKHMQAGQHNAPRRPLFPHCGGAVFRTAVRDIGVFRFQGISSFFVRKTLK